MSYPVARWVEGFSKWQAPGLGRPRAPATVATLAYYARCHLERLERDGADALGKALFELVRQYATNRYPPAHQSLAAWRELLAFLSATGEEPAPAGLPRFRWLETEEGDALLPLGPAVRVLSAGLPPQVLASLTAAEAVRLHDAAESEPVRSAVARLLGWGWGVGVEPPGGDCQGLPAFPRQPGARAAIAAMAVADVAGRLASKKPLRGAAPPLPFAWRGEELVRVGVVARWTKAVAV